MDKYQKTSICSLGITIATAITYACGTPPTPEVIAIPEGKQKHPAEQSPLLHHSFVSTHFGRDRCPTTGC
ncbi:MAG: hypothetical protein Ct9H300mP25_08450 [Acidobacteriota bacterium]|nr:MAG: hypothetical protein Ct9H300mP25_08450 [Acidobacteriota bacterium]